MIRRVSKKRAALNKFVAQFREDLRKEVGRCEFCLKPARWQSLDVHELVTGIDRAKALDKRYAVLCLHRKCHDKIEQLIVSAQIAYLMRARPADYDMPAYHLLTNRNWPDHQDNMSWFRYLFPKNKFP